VNEDDSDECSRRAERRGRAERQAISLNDRAETRFPAFLQKAHDLCFMNHDVLVHLLKAGEERGSFQHQFTFHDDADKRALDDAGDIFLWLDRTRSVADRASFLRRVVFPGVLSDFLHFIYEGLETSRKGKLNVTYALIRKPLQDALFLFEI